MVVSLLWSFFFKVSLLDPLFFFMVFLCAGDFLLLCFFVVSCMVLVVSCCRISFADAERQNAASMNIIISFFMF